MKAKRLTADALGLVVPINIEAMCVGSNTGAIFQPAPYDFSRLPNAEDPSVPNLSEKVMTSETARVNMEVGVHLHWALPDGITKGQCPQDNTGQVQFPNSPDRWLITRVLTDLTNPDRPVNQVKSWVVESNYVSLDAPAASRRSITVPFKTDDNNARQYRYLGRVQEYETWREQFLQKKLGQTVADGDSYVVGLSAVGYGVPEFSASYQSCKSIFGFHDTETDLDLLTVNGSADPLLSYHVVGWYHELSDDPLAQLPLQLDPTTFKAILAKVTDPAEKQMLEADYRVYQSEGPFVLKNGLSAEDRVKLYFILTGGGYDFLTAALQTYQWSLPSGTLETNPKVSHTLLSGSVAQVIWNKSAEYFQALDDRVNISVGNTASQALAALIASLSGIKDQPNVELLLDALQLGQLQGVTDAAGLDRMESLLLELHSSTYLASAGGPLWQVTLIDDDDKGSGEVSLPNELADALNELNLLQSDYELAAAEIVSIRKQIFADWYRFMLVFHRGEHDPDHGLDPNDLATYISAKIKNLNERIQSNKTDKIEELALYIQEKLRELKLRELYELKQASGPRFWQPLEPVVLFQGNEINPPQRYGGDGRFMPDKTLVCRLTRQLVASLAVPVNLLGNPQELKFTSANTPQLPAKIPLDYSDQVHALFTESCLLNPAIMTAVAIVAGAKGDFKTLMSTLKTNQDAFVTPPILKELPGAAVTAIQATVSKDDFAFFLSLYAKTGDNYQLQKPLEDLTDDEKKQLTYIFISASGQWGTRLAYQGIAPSEVYFVFWDGNPWLPFSLSWNVTFYPFAPIDPNNNYDPEFIVENFSLGDVEYAPKGPISVPEVYQTYSNFIFMTPHAEENFQVQIRKYLDHQPHDKPDSPLDKELKAILAQLKDFPPILSQALTGINNAMLMQNEVLQLQIKDPVPGGFYKFTNTTVKDAVATFTQSAPSPGNLYNPIRAGVMSISSLTIVDVFGRNIQIQKPDNVIIAQNMKAKGLPANFAFLAPRIVQAARLSFRWLAASNNALEMNTHPATTPICGWLLANHLEGSLWIYDNLGGPLGSLILTEDSKQVIWQSTPGGDGFGMSIAEYFSTGPGKDANDQLKQLVIALYNDGASDYLLAFVAANDMTFNLVQPQNYKQLGSTAVLMGAPIAVAQARLDLGLNGLPAFNQSWTALDREVNQDQPQSDNGFTKVSLPVRLGAMEQVDDGLLGYFIDGNYGHYYAMEVPKPTDRVTEPDETTIALQLDSASRPVLATLLFDPRGSIHATCGVLPAKEIFLPPDVYADALQALEIAFLTTPILSSIAKLAFPVPAQSGGAWSWLENDLNKWSESQDIAAVDDTATMSYSPQEIKEGWLVLRNFNQ